MSKEIKKAKVAVVNPPIEVEFTLHALARILERKISASLIGPLQARLCQVKIGERIAVQRGDEVLVGQRVAPEKGIVVTAYRTEGSRDAAR